MSKRKSKRSKITTEMNPTTATSTGVRTVWALVVLCGLVSLPIFGPISLAFIIGGLIGILIG